MARRNRTIFDKQGNTYFLTTTVMNYDRIFELGPAYNKIIINSLKHLLKEHKAKLFAYVIMSSHLHFIVYLPENESIIDFMRDFKKFTSSEIRKLAEKEKRKNLINRFRENAKLAKNQKYKIWMDRYDDLIIKTERQMKIKVNYIHYNPVKTEIVNEPEEYVYSSARNYLQNDQSIIKVTTDWSIY